MFVADPRNGSGAVVVADGGTEMEVLIDAAGTEDVGTAGADDGT